MYKIRIPTVIFVSSEFSVGFGVILAFSWSVGLLRP